MSVRAHPKLIEPDLRIGDEYSVPDPRDLSRRVRAELYAYTGPDDARIGWFRPYGENKGFVIEVPLAQCRRTGSGRESEAA